ncbi:hypothetical protein CGMCC3_g9854 [Colletotrichum fructicola]|nr:uncharacterized protein CGMCC3_g9854 [Colletotrichum fructicola]KAE9574200.1 hypothetical protein CGMCC3_g9854 [Colletotrichum fructicola]KAF4430883.1 hypothetical protein CFRS1_v009600 [Colletotrichum fructicola]
MSTPNEKPLPKRPPRFDLQDETTEQAPMTVKPLLGKGLATRTPRDPQHGRQPSFETPEAKARRLERQNAEQQILISDLQAENEELQRTIDQLRGDWERDLDQATLQRSQSINRQLTDQEKALTEMMRAMNAAFVNFQTSFRQSRSNSDVEEIHIYRGSSSSSNISASFF